MHLVLCNLESFQVIVLCNLRLLHQNACLASYIWNTAKLISTDKVWVYITISSGWMNDPVCPMINLWYMCIHVVVLQCRSLTVGTKISYKFYSLKSPQKLEKIYENCEMISYHKVY